MQAYAEKIYVLVHRCHEQCLKLTRSNKLPRTEFGDDSLTTRQGIILKLLHNEDGMTQKEITQKLQITSSSCGELITKLEEYGYLEKRPSPTDKRTFNVYLTKSGQDLAVQYKKLYVVKLEEWASDLSEEEKETLYHLLGKLSNGLEDRITQEFGKKG